MSSNKSVPTFERLDRDINFHLTALAQLRARRNTLLPISRLPPEILVCIFQKFRGMDLSGSSQVYVQPLYPYRWTIVSHICQYWRNVTLDTPELWTYIQIGHTQLDAIKTILAHLKQSPLYIDVYSYLESEENVHKFTEALSLVVPQVHRAHKLRYQTDQHMDAALASQIPTSAPHLLALVLCIDAKHSHLPVLFDKNFVPSLMDLDLLGYTINWANVVFPLALTKLRVGKIGKHMESSVSDVIRAIHPLYFLEHLNIHGRFSPPTSGHHITQTSLPHLQTAIITAPGLTAADFLDGFHVPTTTGITISVHLPVATLRPLADSISSKLTTGLDGEMSTTIVKLSITVYWLYFTKGRPDPAHTSCSPPHFSVQPSSSFDRLTANVCRPIILLRDLCHMFPSKNVTELSLERVPYESEDRDGWLEIFRVLGHLRMITLLGISHAGIIALLSTFFNLHAPVREFVMPLLKRVVLLKIRFRELEDDPEESPYCFVDGLWTASILRQDLNCPLEEIMINGCLNMDSRDVAKLDFVNVVWDGIVQVEDGLERHMNQDRVGDGNNDNTEEEKDDNDDDDEVVF